MTGYTYKENKEFVVLYSFSDREKEFSWLDTFNFKVIPRGLIEETWDERKETFSVFDDLDEKWKWGHKARRMPLYVIQVRGKCPAKKAKSSSQYGLNIMRQGKLVFKEPLSDRGKVTVRIDSFNKEEMYAPDLDNAEKLILDSLTGIAYNDDKQVKKLTMESHDITKVIVFEGQPILLIDLLMKGVSEYIVIRVTEQD
jgi:Holliday junction resolvase RusA-like endonuclease